MAIPQRLTAVPARDQERELPKIVAETYTSVGGGTLGLKALKPNAKNRNEGRLVPKTDLYQNLLTRSREKGSERKNELELLPRRSPVGLVDIISEIEIKLKT